MHPLLARQLRRFGGGAESPPARWVEFLRALEDAYAATDRDRARIERSLELMSGELNEHNARLRDELEHVRRTEAALRESEARLRAEVADRERLAVELRVKQKLESVGQLAAGIAHEINTPIQYVGDSVQFLESAFTEYRRVLGAYQAAMRSLAVLPDVAAHSERLGRLEVEADIAYLEERVPRAFARVCDGAERVASIVRAMKDFANPESHRHAPADLNRALQTTLTIARNEYKYVADVVTELGELPHVTCAVGDLNEVFLTLLVNAAHAIADRYGEDGPRGTIRVVTACEGATVRVTIADDGCGIPEEHRERVFDPFFTTKAPGRGTGQGLAIGRAIVVERHGGTLTFETELGIGTAFTVRLPVEGIASDTGTEAQAA